MPQTTRNHQAEQYYLFGGSVDIASHLGVKYNSHSKKQNGIVAAAVRHITYLLQTIFIECRFIACVFVHL